MSHNEKEKPVSIWFPQTWILILILAVGWSRYLPLSHPELLNFTPVLALFLISGKFLKGHLAWLGPVLAVIVSDLFLNPNYGLNLLEPFMIVTLLSYFCIFLVGRSIQKSTRLLPLFVGAIGSSILFHVVTCGFAWFMNPAYIKTIAGFWQAQFLGEPGYTPAYMFLRNSMISTALFTGLFSFTIQKIASNKNISCIDGLDPSKT
jgi:hypothetical protein